MPWIQQVLSDGSVQYLNTDTGVIQTTVPAGFQLQDSCTIPSGGGDLSALEACCAANTALLTTINSNTGGMVVDLAAIEVLLTDANTCCAANTALLTTIDADTSAISINTAGTITALTQVNTELDTHTTLLTSIDAALGGACPGMNVTICNASIPVTTDLNLTTLETCCAANTALLTTIDADTSAMVTDLAAIETLLTTANACCAANTALLTTIDADTGSLATNLTAILTDTNAMVVDLAALEVCCNANNALLTTIDADTGAISLNTAGTITALVNVNAELDAQTLLLTSIDTCCTANTALLTTIDTDTSAMVADLAAIEVINTDIQTVLRAACGSGNEQNVNVCALPSGVQRTPARLVTTTDGSVAAGTIAVSIHNHGTTDALVLGAILPAGETVTFNVNAPDTLGAIPYVTNGNELHINTIT